MLINQVNTCMYMCIVIYIVSGSTGHYILLLYIYSLWLWRGTIWNFWILQNHRSLRNKGTISLKISLKILYCTIWSFWNYLKYEMLKTISQTNDLLVNLKKENIAYNRSFQRNVFYEKSRILLETKMKYFVIARINQSVFVIKLN